MVFHRPLADCLNGFAAPHGAGRIGRRGDDDCLGAIGTRRFDFVDIRFEALLGAGEHRNRLAAGELDNLRIAGPIRGGGDNFVTGIEQQLEYLVHRLFAAVGDHDLVRRDLVAGIAQRLARDRLTQLGQTGRRSVAVVLRVTACSRRGVDDVIRGGEIRLARTVGHDVDALRLHRLRLRIDSEGRAGGDIVDTVAQVLPVSHSHGPYCNRYGRKPSRCRDTHLYGTTGWSRYGRCQRDATICQIQHEITKRQSRNGSHAATPIARSI